MSDTKKHIENLQGSVRTFLILYILVIIADILTSYFNELFVIYELIRYAWIFFLFFMIPFRIIVYFSKEGLVLNVASAQIITSILLYVGMLPIENMAYYAFVRILVTCLSLAIVFNLYQNRRGNAMPLYTLVFLGLATLYNPIIPFYFDKEIWIGINNITAIIMVAKLFVNQNNTDK